MYEFVILLINIVNMKYQSLSFFYKATSCPFQCKILLSVQTSKHLLDIMWLKSLQILKDVWEKKKSFFCSYGVFTYRTQRALWVGPMSAARRGWSDSQLWTFLPCEPLTLPSETLLNSSSYISQGKKSGSVALLPPHPLLWLPGQSDSPHVDTRSVSRTKLCPCSQHT